jgi:hypothetical protein
MARLRLHYKDQFKLIYTDRPQGGVQIDISIPYKRADSVRVDPPKEWGVEVRWLRFFAPADRHGLIGPFRKLLVYPSLLRTVRPKWNKTYARPDKA